MGNVLFRKNHTLLCGSLDTFLDHVGEEVAHAVAVTPFIVVPADQLEEAAVQGDTGTDIENGGKRAMDEVAGDDLILGCAEDTLHVGLAGLFHSGADLFIGGVLSGSESQIHDGNGRGRNAQRHTGQLAFDLRAHERNSLGGAGGRGDDVGRGGTATFPVLAAGTVNGLLGGGVAVDGGHETFFHADTFLEQDGDQRSQAVGRAGGVGNNKVFGRIIVGVIDTHDDGDVFVLRRSGDDDAFGTGGDVASGLGGISEQTGGFDHDFHAQFFPGKTAGILGADDLDLFAIDDEDIGSFLVRGGLGAVHGTIETTLCRIVFEKISQIVGGNNVTHGNDFDTFFKKTLFGDRAENQATNTSEPIDCNFNCHISNS